MEWFFFGLQGGDNGGTKIRGGGGKTNKGLGEEEWKVWWGEGRQ